MLDSSYRSDRIISIRLAFVWVTVLVVGPTLAANRGDWDDCKADSPNRNIPACTRIIQESGETTSNRALAYLLRGAGYGTKGDHSRAIADFNEAILLDLKSPGVYTMRGNAYGAKGEYDHAIADFNEAILLDPRYEPAYSRRGKAFQAKGDNDRAIADYTEAIRLGSVGADTYNNRGFAYGNKKDYDRAIADYNEAIRLDPKHLLAYGSRGFAYAIKDDYDRAIADFNEAIRIDPTFAGSYAVRGSAYALKGDYEHAIAEYNQSIRLDPKQDRNYKNRGRAYLHAGSLAEAQADFRRASELNPKDVYTLLWLDIAQRRGNVPRDLPEARTKFSVTYWPVPLIHFFLGDLTTTDLFAAANNIEAKKRRDYVCDVNFYSAEMALLKNNKEDAIRLFRAAANDCPIDVVERQEAIVELRKLGVSP